MIEVGDPLTPEQVRLFRVWKYYDALRPLDAASLAFGCEPTEWVQDNEIIDLACAMEEAFRNAEGLPLYSTGYPESIPRQALREWFAKHGDRPAFLYPEAWGKPKPAGGEAAPKAETDPPADPLPEIERMPRLLLEAIRAWREFYDSGYEPPKKADLIKQLLEFGYAETEAEAKAIDKIIRPDKLKQGIRIRKKG